MKTGNPPLQSVRVLDQLRERIRYMHYSLRTEQVYVYWVRFFIRWSARGDGMRHPREMGAADVEAFLTMLATQRNKLSLGGHRPIPVQQSFCSKGDDTSGIRRLEQALSQRQGLIMQTTHTPFDIRALQSSWQAFDTIAHLRPIHSEADFERMVAMMNSLLDGVGDNEDHPLSSLLDLVSDLVSRYEQAHHAIAPALPKDALRFLMEAWGLKQEDL